MNNARQKMVNAMIEANADQMRVAHARLSIAFALPSAAVPDADLTITSFPLYGTVGRVSYGARSANNYNGETIEGAIAILRAHTLVPARVHTGKYNTALTPATHEMDAEAYPDQYDVAPFWLQVSPNETSLRAYVMLLDGRMVDVAIELRQKLVKVNMDARQHEGRRFELTRRGDYEIQYAGGTTPIWYWLFAKQRTLDDLQVLMSPPLDNGQPAAAGEGAGEA